MTEPQKPEPGPRRELFIWWTTSAESNTIGPTLAENLPAYVRSQYADRYVFGHGKKHAHPVVSHRLVNSRSWRYSHFSFCIRLTPTIAGV